MNDAVTEWIAKAEGDYRVAEYELAKPTDPVFDAICYHSQQCIEKLIKAILIQDGVSPPFTHDLVALCSLMAAKHPSWSWNIDDLRFLTLAAVHYRYPGESADRDDAELAFTLCGQMRNDLLNLVRNE